MKTENIHILVTAPIRKA